MSQTAQDQLRNADFYATVAEVLPFLLIALIFEFHEFSDCWQNIRQGLPGGNSIQALGPLVVGLWIGLGEFAALDVLRRQQTTWVDSILIDTALTVTAVALLAPVIHGVAKDVARPNPVTLRHGGWLYAPVVAIFLTAELYFSPAFGLD